jgi:hypothetical protein
MKKHVLPSAVTCLLFITALCFACDFLFLSYFPEKKPKAPAPSLKLRTEAGGGGTELNNPIRLKGLNTITVYAALYDAENNYQEDITVDWTATGIISGNLSTTTGTSTSFLALQTEGTGRITASHTTYGTRSTDEIAVDNKLYLAEALQCRQNPENGAFKAVAYWQFYGGQSYGGNYARCVFLWPLTEGLPENADSVSFLIFHYQCSTSTTSPDNEHASIYQINEAWEDSLITAWDDPDKPDHDTGTAEFAYGLICCTAACSTLDQWIEIPNMAAYYNTWINNPSFYGFVLYSDNAWSMNDIISVRGATYSDPSYRPRLRITKDGDTVDFTLEQLP